MVAESVEFRFPVQKIRSSNPSLVKSLIYKIDAYRYLAKHLALLGKGKDWLAQYQGNVTEY